MSRSAKAAALLAAAHTVLKTARKAETDVRFIKRLISRRPQKRTKPLASNMARKRTARRARTSRAKRRKYSTTGRVKTKRQIPSSNYRRTTRRRTTNPRSALNSLLGPVPGYQSRVKKALFEGQSFSPVNTNTLYSAAIIRINHDPDEDNMQTRHSNSCLVRGAKITYKFSINEDYQGAPIRIQWAIVANKIVNQPVNSTTELPTTNWWEHVAPTYLNDTGQDFTVNDSSIKYEKRRINPIDYLVLKRGSFTLENNRPLVLNTNNAVQPTPNVTGSENLASGFKTVNAYIPLNTQMRWIDVPSTYPAERNLYMCWWCYPMNKLPTDIDQTPVVKLLRYSLTYFEDSTM